MAQSLTFAGSLILLLTPTVQWLPQAQRVFPPKQISVEHGPLEPLIFPPLHLLKDEGGLGGKSKASILAPEGRGGVLPVRRRTP